MGSNDLAMDLKCIQGPNQLERGTCNLNFGHGHRIIRRQLASFRRLSRSGPRGVKALLVQRQLQHLQHAVGPADVDPKAKEGARALGDSARV